MGFLSLSLFFFFLKSRKLSYLNGKFYFVYFLEKFLGKDLQVSIKRIFFSFFRDCLQYIFFYSILYVCNEIYGEVLCIDE